MAHVRVGGAEAVPRLPYEAVFRIEVSLSSQSTSAIVMRTTAQLYCLEGTHSSKPTTGEQACALCAGWNLYVLWC